jgi:O-antigen ligase
MLLQPIVQASLNPIVTLKMSPYGAHYDTAVKIFNDNKLFGIGLKNFRIESGNPKYRNKEFIFTDARQTTHPHQIHFEILSEIGLVGYLLFLLLFYFSISSYIKSYKNSKSLFQLSSLLFIIATIIPFLPSGSFFTTYSATIFWINFGLLIQKK